jgi:outer membrane autotransporter protein
VDILFAGMPLVAHTSIDFAHVSGTSTAGSFVPGQILSYNHARNFLDIDFSIGSRLNAANTADDVFSIDLDVVGLNDSGTLAANVASGAAGMLNAQVGTFKQRMGVNPYGDAGKVMSAFFRTYTSEGDVNPDHVAANFGQGGNFDYDLSTWGREVGVNANLFGNVHAGITVGTADGRQRLTGAGVGSNRMDGMTWGLYATWLAPQGFYLDVSGRWMAVDVLSTSAAGQLQTRAHTGAWNLETGYQWAMGGLSIVPQLQYTRTEVEDVRAIYGDRANFEGHGGVSERARLGVEVSKTFQSGNVRWTPYGSINAIREFDGKMDYTVADNFFGNTSTEGSSTMAELGLGVQAGGWGFTIGANWVDGGAFKSTVGGQAVIRFAW